LFSILVCIHNDSNKRSEVPLIDVAVAIICFTLLSTDNDSVHQMGGETDFSLECPYVIDLPPCYKSIVEESPPPYESVVNKYKLENYVVNTRGVNHI
ncbi:hypothetical protein Bhyg_09669, partial [Pseudolycoriella hygida]